MRRRVARFPPGEIRFALMAVVQDPRVRAAEIGDAETLRRERARRAAWAWENALRRANFLAFTGEVMKGVVAAKGRGGEYGDWVEGAKAATRKRVEGRNKGGDGEEW